MIYDSYSELINKLLLEDQKKTASKRFLLSLYLDVKNKPRSEVETLINSWLKKGFTSNYKLKGENRKRNKLHYSILDEMKKIPDFESGLGIFVKFSLSHNKFETNVINLHRTPENEVVIGKLYDVDQLIWLDSYSSESLVINLQPEYCRIFSLEASSMEKTEEIKSKISDKTEKEQRENYTPIFGESQIYHGTGEINMQRQKKQARKKLWDEVLERLRENFEEGKKFKYIAVFYSPSYEFMSDDMEKRLRGAFLPDPILEPADIQNDNELKKTVLETLRKYEKKHMEDLYSFAKSKPSLFVEGWSDVTQASRMGKIDTLFIRPDVKKIGYLMNHDLIYLHPVKNSRRVGNIAPWLVRGTLNKSGKVYVIKEDDSYLKEDVAAKLRF